MSPRGRHPRIKGATTAGGRMRTVIILIHLMIVLAMIGVVLLQKSEGGGLGIGSTGGFLSRRGNANGPPRTPPALAAPLFRTRFLLSILAGWDRKPTSIIQNTGAPAQQTPGGPAGQGGGVLDTLRQHEQQPAAPPPGPQVPRSQ